MRIHTTPLIGLLLVGAMLGACSSGSAQTLPPRQAGTKTVLTWSGRDGARSVAFTVSPGWRLVWVFHNCSRGVLSGFAVMPTSLTGIPVKGMVSPARHAGPDSPVTSGIAVEPRGGKYRLWVVSTCSWKVGVVSG